MIKTVIFDFDGTMFHTAPEIHRAINATLKDLSHHELSYDEVKNCIGQGLLYLLEHLNLDIDRSAEGLRQLATLFRSHYGQIFLESKAFPGLYEFLSSCPQQIAIGSNKDELYIRRCMSVEPWNQLQWLAMNGGNTFPTKKPEPEMIHDILQKASCQPHEMAIIGDGIPDVEVAKNTGIFCVAVSYGYTPIDELMSRGAHVKIDHLDELPEALRYL